MGNQQVVQVAKKYIGKSVDIDGYYGAQCVDYSNRVAMDIDVQDLQVMQLICLTLKIMVHGYG